MVTTLLLNRVRQFACKKILPEENSRPESYMEALESSGFSNVRMENRKHKLGVQYEVIFATALK